MKMLLGDEAMARLRQARVLLFGVGGVGSFAAEALARAGIGAIDIVDNDTVGLTNLNRQLVALHSTIGQKKIDVMAARIRDINPEMTVKTHDVFVTDKTIGDFDFSQYDYVLDAIDTVSAKLLIVSLSQAVDTPVICSMGTGNKLDPTQLVVTDVFKTAGDPLARVMRRELKKLGVRKLKVVCSLEQPRKLRLEAQEETSRRSIPASVSFVPPVAGMILAGEAVKDIIRDLL